MGSELVREMVSQDPVLSLAIARDLARQGLDTTELHEAAMIALAPRKQPKEAARSEDVTADN